MDVDNDPIDQSLLLQFTCLGTTDRDDLIKQFKEMVENRENDVTASFFLEMNNWNLQNALGSYFDYENPRSGLGMEAVNCVISSVNSPPVSINQNGPTPAVCLPPNTVFTISWTLRNSGEERWPITCVLHCVNSNYLSDTQNVLVGSLIPGATKTVVVDLITPSASETYSISWRLMTTEGRFFGETLNVCFHVVEEDDVRLSEELATRMALADNVPMDTIGRNIATVDPYARFYGPVNEHEKGDSEEIL